MREKIASSLDGMKDLTRGDHLECLKVLEKASEASVLFLFKWNFIAFH